MFVTGGEAVLGAQISNIYTWTVWPPDLEFRINVGEVQLFHKEVDTWVL